MNVVHVIRDIPQLQWERNRGLRNLTSFGIGGPAQVLVRVNSVDALMRLQQRVHAQGIQVTMLGGGTNVLISDAGIQGITLKLGKGFEYYKVLSRDQDCVYVKAGSATALPAFHRWAWRQGLGNTADLVGIPGTIGGAVAVNAGTRTRAIGSIVSRVGLVTTAGELVEMEAEAMRFGYRTAWIPDGWVAVYVIVCLAPSISHEERAMREKLIDHRLATQPHGSKCAGSFFKNPDPVNGPFAGQLIERAGMKGARRGGAMVSRVHANFLVNQGWATARDVMELAREVHERVKALTGVSLVPEVRFVGKGLQWEVQ